MSTPPPFFVRLPPVPPLMTPERMPAVTMVPVLPLALAVTVRTAVPKLMSLANSVSPSAVLEPRTREEGLKVAPPQITAPPPRVTTSRSAVEAAKPEAPPVSETLPIPATAAPRERVKLVAVSRTPPLRTSGLVADRPCTDSAALATLNAPAETVVVPV